MVATSWSSPVAVERPTEPATAGLQTLSAHANSASEAEIGTAGGAACLSDVPLWQDFVLDESAAASRVLDTCNAVMTASYKYTLAVITDSVLQTWHFAQSPNAHQTPWQIKVECIHVHQVSGANIPNNQLFCNMSLQSITDHKTDQRKIDGRVHHLRISEVVSIIQAHDKAVCVEDVQQLPLQQG